jgi:hypothetical protein
LIAGSYFEQARLMPGARKANLPVNCLLLGKQAEKLCPSSGMRIPNFEKRLAYYRHFEPDKWAETILTVARGVNIHYENLDHPLNYLHLRKAGNVGAARN